MARARRPRASVRRRGNSYQVRVYAGTDPLTGKDTYLSESTRDERQVEKIKTRLLAKVDQQRSASSRGTLSYALDVWLDNHDGAEDTVSEYRGYAERTIKPALGNEPLAKLDPLILEKFYTQLRRCSKRCNGKPFTEHAVDGPHECGAVVKHYRAREHDCDKARCRRLNCRDHQCKPLAPATIRQIHWIISGTLNAAVRWGWIDSNPAPATKKPRQPLPDPQPPRPSEAAQIIKTAFEIDHQWGVLVWLTMVTGIRRGELCALRWHDVDFEAAVLTVRRSYRHRHGTSSEKDTKTHQRRRIALDEETLALLHARREAYESTCQGLGVAAEPDAFIFSYDPAHTKPCSPDGVGTKYTRTCRAAGVDSHIHALRHYSATELINAGVDVRTVAGRLGHGGGGNTTLRVYAAWVAESDKRAADILASRMKGQTR